MLLGGIGCGLPVVLFGVGNPDITGHSVIESCSYMTQTGDDGGLVCAAGDVTDTRLRESLTEKTLISHI